MELWANMEDARAECLGNQDLLRVILQHVPFEDM